MLSTIKLNSGNRQSIRGLCFTLLDGRTPSEVVHQNPDDSNRISCAEYNQQSIETIAQKQKWCSPCTEMLLGLMITKGCSDCEAELLARSSHEFAYNLERNTPSDKRARGPPSWHDPRWFALEDKNIQQLRAVKPTDVSGGQFPWATPLNETDGTALETLGLDPGCHVCFGLARTLLRNFCQRKRAHGKTVLRDIRVKFDASFQHPYHDVDDLDFVAFEVMPRWYDAGETQTRQDHLSFSLVVDRSAQNLRLRYQETCRFNAIFLREQLKQKVLECGNGQGESKDVQNTEFPTGFRLIDVNDCCVVAVGNMYLKYSAVSYRWDPTPDNMFTREKEEEFMRPGSLSLETMSQTLYDCMVLARDLHIPYIWVDRYCIQQDNESDKQEQIKAMGYIYENSWLTMICALSGDMHAGLSGYSRDFMDFQRPKEPRDCHGTADMWKLWPYRKESGWMKRGWTMQEEHLSPRRLYITAYTVLWHIGCPTVMLHHTAHPKQLEVDTRCCLTATESLSSILEMYVGRALSKAEDRVNAIVGFLKNRGVDHVYGIGTRNLRCNLIWSPINRFLLGNEEAQPDKNFPSWSWAYFHQKVFWPDVSQHRVQAVCQVLHAKSRAYEKLRLARRMRLSTTFANRIQESEMVIHARSRPLQPQDRASLDKIHDVHHVAGATVVDIYRTINRRGDKMDVYSLVVKTTTEDRPDAPNITYARRIGSFCRSRKVRRPWHKLASIRPMATHSLARIKKFRCHRCIGGRKEVTGRKQKLADKKSLHKKGKRERLGYRTFVLS